MRTRDEAAKDLQNVRAELQKLQTDLDRSDLDHETRKHIHAEKVILREQELLLMKELAAVSPSEDADDDKFKASLQGGGNEALSTQPWRTLRRSTAQAVWEQLKKCGYMFIKAPPFSGKSSLLQLVQDYLRTSPEGRGTPVYYVPLIPCRCIDHIDARIKQKTGRTLIEWFQGRSRAVLLLDEAQVTYRYPDAYLWSLLKLLGAGDSSVSHLRILISAAYGMARSGRPASPSTPAPIPISPSPSMVISLQRTPGQPSLTLDEAEYDELWEAWIAYFSLTFTTDSVKRFVFDIAGAQVGLVVHCLSEVAKQLTNTEDLDDVAWHFLHMRSFYDSLYNVRSITQYEELMHLQGAETILSDLLRTGSFLAVKYGGPLAKTVNTLYCNGHLIVNETTKRYSFTSPLHEQFFMLNHYCALGWSQPRHAPSRTLQELITRVLERMSSKALHDGVGVGTDGRLLERSWQMEFYRAVCSLLPEDDGCSPDVCKYFGSSGYIDFYLTKSRWAIELLRDGSGVEEHLDRFQTGRYHGMVERGNIVDYKVVDLRGPSAINQPETINHDNLITATFSFDYKVAHVMHKGSVVDLRVGG
mmetsp:Transcript_34380/g.76356  ORF Transcript_34380/g.76356 Transcript_34380/m.76356 type:complete len:586 (-) Transcript_34380:879-2636(-)